MTEHINLLIVEDTESDIQSYKDSIRTVNTELAPDFKIVPIIGNDKEEGLNALRNQKDKLHGAFIDLKLTQGTPVDVNEGNDLVNEIYGKLRFPVRVLTNTPNGVTPGIPQSLFFQVLAKTDIQYVDVLKEIVQIHKTGITKILGGVGKIEEMLNDIFWKNISLSLKEWIDVPNAEKHLLRYSLTHLQENLEITDDGSQFDNVFPIENYIKPSIKKYFYTGDIIHKKEEKGKRFIILTPACDLAPHGEKMLPKAKDILLAEIQSLSESVFEEKQKEIKEAIANGNEPRYLDAEREFKKILSNNYSPKYYFIPDTKSIKGGLINFQKLSSIKFTELNKNYEKDLTITAQFVKDIISKFSFYYSRQGSPDFDFDSLIKQYIL